MLQRMLYGLGHLGIGGGVLISRPSRPTQRSRNVPVDPGCLLKLSIE